MRSDPADYQILTPGSLQEVIRLLAKAPGVWLPIAGGTDVMVMYGAGTLPSRNLVSIWNLRELRGIEESAEEIKIGAVSTYTELREHPSVKREFPLLERAASWTGGIANQNRGTLGGNIANASPAADCLPALLAYDAELTLTSLHGDRRVKYRNFHTGYKRTIMAADELILAIHLKKKFLGYHSYARKAGARQSQAIAKVSVAALARVRGGIIEDARVAVGSVAPVPLRLDTIERLMIGNKPEELSVKEMRRAVVTEIAPIDDIRSTAQYRAAVTGNLVVEFLELLRSAGGEHANDALARWNMLTHEEATKCILPCCGARAWADTMAERRPFADISSLLEASVEIWSSLDASDLLEAFGAHPRIGESKVAASSTAKAWSSEEQRRVMQSDDATKAALADGNRRYEKRFGRTFIVCATGKSPDELLQNLERRLQNDESAEFKEAVEEQQKIMQIRLQKWFEE